MNKVSLKGDVRLTENAITVLRARYLLKNDSGKIIETPEGMFRRVAHAIAAADSYYHDNPAESEEKYYELMTDLRFLPNSPTLMNAGKSLGQLAACFVLPVGDSMHEIFDTLKNAALILQSGGGTGFSFSQLRPKADIVRSTGGVASGPVSFMKVYNTATEVIKQGGARRGANMGVLRVDHPDIIEFIRVKRSEKELMNFNVSVAVTDAFIDALKKNAEFELINPRTGESVRKMRAQHVFDEIVESAWETGDPGIIFIDRINKANPTPHVGPMESTNPCGEQPLLPYEACILGSLNFRKYVKSSEVSRGGIWQQHIDFQMLEQDIGTAVRFLDNAIDVNNYPVPAVEEMHKGNRKIGLGVMGWADMLVRLGIPYDSQKAFDLAREVMKFVRDRARRESASLAAKRGPFPNFKGSVYDMPGMPRLRNATLTTIAPTGTLSIIADCSSGIEPLFALAYRRLVLDTELYEINTYFFDVAQQSGFYHEGLEAKVIKKGDLRGIKEVPLSVRRVFKTALEIPPQAHIEMQACFQEFTDNAVSKTINMPYRATKSDVANAFLLAYEKGCKGITVFRSGTKKRGTLMRIVDSD